VSQGPPPVTVPTLSSQMTLQQAQQALQNAHLVAGTPTNRPDENVPKGNILDYSPKGPKLPKGRTVNLVVSSGPAPRVVPALAGKSEADARAELAGMKLAVETKGGFSDDVQPGQVINSSPPAGTSVARGAPITLIISQGPLTVQVPDVTGRPI